MDKLSELIKNLQRVVDEHGDLPYKGTLDDGRDALVGVYVEEGYVSIELALE